MPQNMALRLQLKLEISTSRTMEMMRPMKIPLTMNLMKYLALNLDIVVFDILINSLLKIVKWVLKFYSYNEFKDL